MEHRNNCSYRGYEIHIFVSHEGDLSVTISLDGDTVNKSFGNPEQAKEYIDDIVFHREGILINEGVHLQIRLRESKFKVISEDIVLESLALDSTKNNVKYYLGNEIEILRVEELLGLDLSEYCFDYIKVYWGEVNDQTKGI